MAINYLQPHVPYFKARECYSERKPRRLTIYCLSVGHESSFKQASDYMMIIFKFDQIHRKTSICIPNKKKTIEFAPPLPPLGWPERRYKEIAQVFSSHPKALLPQITMNWTEFNAKQLKAIYKNKCAEYDAKMQSVILEKFSLNDLKYLYKYTNIYGRMNKVMPFAKYTISETRILDERDSKIAFRKYNKKIFNKNSERS